MDILYALLKEGGKFILNDFHPFRKIISANSGQVSSGDYFDTSILKQGPATQISSFCAAGLC